MSEVKYEDEKKLLTSDEFIAAAKQNADKNLQIQKDTAQKVYDSTYASLDRQYNEAAAAAGVAKQRNLIDADTAYQRQEMKYGAEQEALAAAGLSGSGMNEYRRAQSYQKNREDRQMSYAEYDRALREANYARDQGKLAADLNKAQSDAAAEMHYNDTMTGIAEKELGYAELERQEISTAYGSYINGINDGSMTLDQIKADASWAKLSPEQQASVEKTAKIKGIKTKIDNGDNWENVQNSYAYLELDEDGRNQVDGYHAQVVAGKTKDANAASGNYLEMAMKGMSIDSIVALAKANGHYQTLVDSGFWNAVTAEAEKVTNEQSKSNVEGQTAINDENFANWVSALRTGGATLADIQALSGYANLTAAQKSQLESAATAYTDKQNAADLKEQNYINDTNFASWLSSIGNGKLTLADAQAMSGYENLSPNQKAQLQTAENNRVAKSGLADKTERADRIVTYGDLARGGMSLDELKATMALYGDDWDNLDPKEQKVIQMAADAYTAAQKKLESEDRPNQIAGLADLAAKGYSIDEIKQWAAIYGITNLGENELAVIQNSADRYAAAQEKLNSENEMDRALGYVGLLEAGWTFDDVIGLIGGEEALEEMGTEAQALIKKSAEVISRLESNAANKKAKDALASYISAASEGLSIDTIKAIAMANGHFSELSNIDENGVETGYWKAVSDEALKYTNDQEKAKADEKIERDYNTALGLLADGWTLDEIKNHLGADAVKALTDSGKFAQIENASNVMARIKSETEGKAAQESLLTYLDLAASGEYTLDQLKAVAQSLGHYDALDEAGYWAQVENKFNEIESSKGLATDSIAISLEGYASLSEVEKYLTSEMVPKEERAGIIAKWQSNNAEDFEDLLGEAKLENGVLTVGGEAITGADLYEDIKNGLYGDKGDWVIQKYVSAVTSAAPSLTLTLEEIAVVRKDLSDLAAAMWVDGVDEEKIRKLVTFKTDPSVWGITVKKAYKSKEFLNTYVIDGVDYEVKRATIDPNVLNSITSYGENFVQYKGKYYYKGDKDWWWEVTPEK